MAAGNAYLEGRDRMTMKRVLKFLPCLCAVLLILLCSSACADPAACPYDIHLSIMYNFLTESQRTLFDRMYDALWNGQSAVAVPEDMTREETEWMVDYIYNEAPELCAYDRWGTKVVNISGNKMEVRFAYKMPIAEQQRFIAEVSRDAQKYAGKSPADGVWAICDALIRRFDYGKIPGEDTQLAYFALKNNTAVCNGYAQTTAMYCHFAGYSCSYIDGHAFNSSGEDLGGHAWNVACVDGEYIWFDLTWVDDGDKVNSKWYGLTGAEMEAQRHKADGEYKPILNLTSILPDDVTFTMHLDINNADGFKRGITQKQGITVKQSELLMGEYYSPALVIWNESPSPVRVKVSYNLDGKYRVWKESEIKPGSNIAFRTNASHLKGQAGNHEIIWYCGGMRLGDYFWRVN